MTINEKIERIESSVFDYDIANVTNEVVGLFSDIIETRSIDTGNQGVVLNLNAIMGKCLAALQNKDYLLLADILEYELKPMLIEKQGVH